MLYWCNCPTIIQQCPEGCSNAACFCMCVRGTEGGRVRHTDLILCLDAFICDSIFLYFLPVLHSCHACLLRFVHLYGCVSATVLWVRIHNSVSVDLPVGIPLPFNSFGRGVPNLPLPYCPSPPSLPLTTPTNMFCFPKYLPLLQPPPPAGVPLGSRTDEEIWTNFRFRCFWKNMGILFHSINNAHKSTLHLLSAKCQSV